MKKGRLLKSISQSKLPRGPNGRFLCRFCESEVPIRRKTLCSASCAHEYRIRSSASYARYQVYLRDRSICTGCGVNTDKLARVCQKLARPVVDRRYKGISYNQYVPQPRNYNAHIKPISLLSIDICRLQQISNRYPWLYKYWDQKLGSFKTSLWQADHILSVESGGGSCGLENLRTLCLGCHMGVTTIQNSARNKRKRIVKTMIRKLTKG